MKNQGKHVWNSLRNRVRLISFSLALVVALGTAFAVSAMTALRYRTRLEYTYERGLTELSEHLNNIETTLTKGLYSATPAGTARLAMNLRSQADSAKVCLSQLPSYGTDLEQTYKFLSQVGEYALSLSRQMQTGTPVDTAQHSQMVKLSQFSKSVNRSVEELCHEMSKDGRWKQQIEATMGSSQEQTPLSTGLKNTEETLHDFPTLLYDGPFSEHILQAEPLFIKSTPEVSLEKAAEIAAKAIGADPSETGEGILQEKGTIPSYLFYTSTHAVAVTRQGGILNYFDNNRAIGDTKLQFDQCVEKAKAYLETMNLGTFKESYYSVFEGVCLINFAYVQEDVICYTDLIKIGVALDNGEIVSFNAQGFIMNHTDRKIKKPSHTHKQAEKVISPYLTVQSFNRAIIPLNTREPKLCYEFLCTGTDQEEILVYINAETLEEEELLIVVKTDGGTLTL